MSLKTFNDSGIVVPWLVAQPAAGADWVLTVPAGLWYRVETGFGTLVASAAVANRIVKLQIQDASNNIVWEGGIQGVFTATQTARMGLTRGGGQAAASGSNVPNPVTIPDVWLPAGYTLRSATTAIDVGDQWSAIRGLLTQSSTD